MMLDHSELSGALSMKWDTSVETVRITWQMQMWEAPSTCKGAVLAIVYYEAKGQWKFCYGCVIFFTVLLHIKLTCTVKTTHRSTGLAWTSDGFSLGTHRRKSEQTLLLLGRSFHFLRDIIDCICQVSCGVFKASKQFVNLLSLNKGLYIEPHRYVAIPGRSS